MVSSYFKVLDDVTGPTLHGWIFITLPARFFNFFSSGTEISTDAETQQKSSFFLILVEDLSYFLIGCRGVGS